VDCNWTIKTLCFRTAEASYISSESLLHSRAISAGLLAVPSVTCAQSTDERRNCGAVGSTCDQQGAPAPNKHARYRPTDDILGIPSCFRAPNSLIATTGGNTPR
jgi:hypothetical protein